MVHPKEKIKIVFVITSTGIGGAEKMLYHTCTSLDRTRYVPFICSLKAKGAIARDAEKSGIEVHCLTMAGGDQLGGWLKEAMPMRGARVIAYHKNWAYFAETFGLNVAGYIEPKPGIPPSAKHVQKMTELIKNQNIKVMLVASYFEKKSPQMIEDKTGIEAVYLPLFVSGMETIENNFDLMDYWIKTINKAIQ